MKPLTTLGAAILLVAGLSVGSQAQDKKTDKAPPGPTISLAFTAVDTDKDRRISKAEWEAFFVKLDTDKDEFLSEQEFQAAQPKKQKDGGK